MELRTSMLTVNIDEPGQQYRGSRFDWTGFIRQVTLDDQHTFCVEESLQPDTGTGGVGLCNEFGILYTTGYDDARPGEQFPKIGIGLLTRPDDEPYKFARPYEVQPFPVHVSTEPQAITFTVDPLECRGYAVRLQKRISVQDATLKIDYRLENVGTKPITTNEYAHNFIGIDNHFFGPDYCLRLSNSLQCEKAQPDVLDINSQEVRWKTAPEQPYYCRTVFDNNKIPGWWELVHEPSKVGLREEDSFAWATLAVWGTPHVVSPEAFITINLAPGTQQEWWREYTFFNR